MEKVERQEKNDSSLAAAQNPAWLQILNCAFSVNNEGMDTICQSLEYTSFNDFFRQEEDENKENDKSAGESDEALVNGDDSRMDKGMIKTLQKMDNRHQNIQ